MASEIENDSNFNPRRRLCPDGGCVGIIGADGKCTECGICDTSEAGSPSPAPNISEDSAESDAVPSEPGNPELSSDFDPNRRLCSDDACVGVIGEDNRCRLCGKPAAA
jgi:hypothetical protein